MRICNDPLRVCLLSDKWQDHSQTPLRKEHTTDCDTIFDINLTVLAEPVYDIGPNPTKSLLNINSDGFISAVEFYSVTGQLVMRKEVNGYEAEFDMEGLVDGVYILRIYGEESSLPSVSKVVKE